MSEGVIKELVSDSERSTEKGRERGLGRVLSKQDEAVLVHQTDEARVVLQLKKEKKRWEGG